MGNELVGARADSRDLVFKNFVLKHPRASEMKYCILYESTGRLGSFSSPDYSNLIPDFDYMNANFFSNPNYYKIEGKPVVFIYLTRVYFTGSTAANTALANLRAAYPNLYLVGDHIWNGVPASQAAQFEAVTAYDIYGQALSPYGSTTAAVNRIAWLHASAQPPPTASAPL